MSKTPDIKDFANATPAVSATGTVGALENLAGFVEDINNLTMRELSDQEQLDKVVRERFGPKTSTQDVIDAMGALRDLSLSTLRDHPTNA